MIDEKGRLFGKINLIDLLVIIVVVAAVAFLGFKFLGPAEDTGGTQKVIVSVYCEEASTFAVDKLAVGDEIYDSAANTVLGSLSSWETGDSESYLTNPSGVIVPYSKETFRSVVAEIECAGVIGPHGVTINGTLYGIGHSMAIYSGNCKMFVRVSEIQAVD